MKKKNLSPKEKCQIQQLRVIEQQEQVQKIENNLDLNFEKELEFSQSDYQTAVKVLKGLMKEQKRPYLKCRQMNELKECLKMFNQKKTKKEYKAQQKEQQRIEKQLDNEKAQKQLQVSQKQAHEGIQEFKKLEQKINRKIFISKGKPSVPVNQLESEQDINQIEFVRNEKRLCYCCKQKFQNVHHFYSQMCKSCGDFNYEKRYNRCDLNGKIALLTGGRIKIGFEIALQLLRNRCFVILTTRFPKDAARRFQMESDYQSFERRIHIYGLDLRYVPGIKEFCGFLKDKYSHLDIIINNAAQTIRKPTFFYEELVQNELTPLSSEILPHDFKLFVMEKQKSIANEVDQVEINGVSSAAQLSSLKLDLEDNYKQDCTQKDTFGNIIDLRSSNSWKKQIDEVSLVELMEVTTINQTAPFLINSQLKPMLENSPSQLRFIVNVSACEGQFYKRYKSSAHPHTNMAKAALNMMTRTVGSYYRLSNIYMNSVDTGWVTDENPLSFIKDREVPLDELDGAMRVLDPIFSGLQGKELVHSKFLKDYKESDW